MSASVPASIRSDQHGHQQVVVARRGRLQSPFTVAVPAVTADQHAVAAKATAACRRWQTKPVQPEPGSQTLSRENGHEWPSITHGACVCKSPRAAPSPHVPARATCATTGATDRLPELQASAPAVRWRRGARHIWLCAGSAGAAKTCNGAPAFIAELDSLDAADGHAGW